MHTVRIVPAGAHTRTIRIDRETHEELMRLAVRGGSTVAETVDHAVRLLGQDVRALPPGPPPDDRPPRTSAQR